MWCYSYPFGNTWCCTRSSWCRDLWDVPKRWQRCHCLRSQYADYAPSLVLKQKGKLLIRMTELWYEEGCIAERSVRYYKWRKILGFYFHLSSTGRLFLLGFPIQIGLSLNSVGSGHLSGPPYYRSLSANSLLESSFLWPNSFISQDFFFFADERDGLQNDHLHYSLSLYIRSLKNLPVHSWPFIFHWYHQSPKTLNKTFD